MTSADRFVALLAGIVAIIGALAAVIRVLVKISYQMGQLVQRVEDMGNRLSAVESRRRR